MPVLAVNNYGIGLSALLRETAELHETMFSVYIPEVRPCPSYPAFCILPQGLLELKDSYIIVPSSNFHPTEQYHWQPSVVGE